MIPKTSSLVLRARCFCQAYQNNIIRIEKKKRSGLDARFIHKPSPLTYLPVKTSKDVLENA